MQLSQIQHPLLEAGLQRLLALVVSSFALAPLGADAAALRTASVAFEPPASGSGLMGGAFATGSAAFMQSNALQAQVPGSYWSGAPTPAPPSLGPGPYPQLMWVEQKPLPLPATTPPVYEQCHGCHCMFIFPDGFTAGGNIANDYTCFGGAATKKIPSIKWVGQPGQETTDKKGKDCPACSSYALTVEDLDFPNGNGETTNHIRSIFWAVNIPGDWTEINDGNAFDPKSGVVVGQNLHGEPGLDEICPKKGAHRYKITLWAITGYLGTSLDPFSPGTAADAVKAALEAQELARATFFANLMSPGYQG